MTSPDVVTFIHDLEHDDLPAEVATMTRRLLLDLVGVAAAGSATPMSRIVRDHAARHLRGDPDTARLLFDGRGVGAVGAALGNAATIDAMDAHDGHRLTKGHAGAAVLPAVLACIAADASVRDLVTDLVVGYEVATRAGIAVHATTAEYHSSGAWNALGAAAVGARALSLDPGASRHALGTAEYHGPRAPMMRCLEHPTMVKDSSAWGAHVGVSAALLAADGFTGAPASVLTKPAELWTDLGRRWRILEQYVKPYPVCRWAQPAVRAVLDVVRTRDIRPAAIRQIRVHTFDPATRLSIRRPSTTEEAQYSLPFAVAAAAVHRELPAAVVAQPGQAGEEVERLACSMEITESADMTGAFPGSRLGEVTVVLGDGQRFRSGPLRAAGDPDEPLDDEALAGKFLTLTAPVLGDARARRLLEMLSHADQAELPELLHEIHTPR